MELLIERAIETEAKRRLARYSQNQYYIHKYRAMFSKRTKKKAKASPHALPISWAFHRHYDPRYCLNHSSFLARGLWSSLRAGLYQPTSAFRMSIPKATGGFRHIDSFSVPDAAIGSIFLRNLRARNAKVFSDSSYAYQENKTPLDAVLRITSILSGQAIFISQYDFSRYFDSISHNYMEQVLGSTGPFLTTHMERHVLQAVMTHSFTDRSGSRGVRTEGIPQGNSLSLFLANAAAHSLDTELGQLNGAFARFADDSVVVNHTYDDALRCADAYYRFSRLSGVSINQDKSSGIRILSERPAEIARIPYFDFLSYRFRQDGLGLSGRAVAGIKRRCAKIIYNHLLLHPRRTNAYNRKRLGTGFRDWDLVTCINELRAYIYGGRSQAEVEQFLDGALQISNFTGAVSYFALVKDGNIFRELDGWLIYALERAYAARLELLRSISGRAHRRITRQQLLSGNWYKFPAVDVETQAPSFFTAWRASRKAWLRHGLGGVDVLGAGYAY